MSDKPKPVPDADSQSFWDACKEGRLLGQRCEDCGRWRHPPRGVCPHCASWRFTWQPLEPSGVIRGFVVPHRPFSPGFADDVPYVVAHVEVDATEGDVVLVTNLAGIEWPDVRVGMRVALEIDNGLPRARASH